MRRVAGLRMIAAVFCLYACVQLCSGVEIPCSVTQEQNQIIYNIANVDPKATGCHYSWANADLVMANHVNHTSPVITNNISALVTEKCLENIIYTRDCISEGIEYTANCTISCGESGDPVLPHVSWIAPTVVVVAVVLLVAGLSFLFWKFRDKVQRMFCQCGGFYSVVKSTDLKEVVV